MKRRPTFDKYDYYLKSVQEPEETLRFVERVYRKSRGVKPRLLGEDFCGTFALSCAWVRRGKDRRAVAVDISEEPILYGMKNYASQLSASQSERLQVIQADVRNPSLPQVDVLIAMNFSYFTFKTRPQLAQYLRACRRRLRPKGMLFLDCFGGTDTQEPVLDRIPFPGFTYYWDQVSFDPITHEAKFYIHYKRRGERKRSRVFAYDWRLWTVPEIRELLCDCGFNETAVYWEGTAKNGEGNGVFTEKNRETNAPAWIAYITAN